MVRLRAILVPSALVVSSLVVTTLLLEILVRTTPVLWPPGAYSSPQFSADLAMTVHAVPTIYTRRRWMRRAPNHEGLLDVDHARGKPPGVTRVGFFGDSYVEALQVPLEETFFRRLPTDIAGRTVEALAFGISGWGTLHSLMAYRVMGPRYDLDDVVYLFAMNDPGDNFSKVSRRLPTAALADDGTDFVIRPRAPPIDSPGERLTRWVDRELMLARLIRVRLAMLQANAGTPSAVRVGDASWVPDRNDLPSTWPPALREETLRLTRHILRRFQEEVLRDGRRFAVLYVPRGNGDLDGTLRSQDSWFPWLSQTCVELGIRLLDPRDWIRTHRVPGSTIYDDHWSPEGHALIAAFVAEALADAYAAEPTAPTSARARRRSSGQ
jgi:hypothetical protein